MRLFLAGNPLSRVIAKKGFNMRMFLVEAGAVAKGYLDGLAKEMDCFLAAVGRVESDLKELKKRETNVFCMEKQPQLKAAFEKLIDPNYSLYRGARILQSFSYADKFTENEVLPVCADFMLDSGAFTFSSKKTNIDWDSYIEKYADFICRNRVEKFFELDIDALVGYKEVKRLRGKLESLVGKRCIPVWHKSRGKEEFVAMCNEYNYVAIGGIVSKEIRIARGDDKYFPWFINEAHRRGAKIHALGFSSDSKLKKYRFDSVDSSSWVAGNRYGYIYKFTGQGMRRVESSKGKWVDTNLAAVNNFLEWKKFSDWAYYHL